MKKLVLALLLQTPLSTYPQCQKSLDSAAAKSARQKGSKSAAAKVATMSRPKTADEYRKEAKAELPKFFQEMLVALSKASAPEQFHETYRKIYWGSIDGGDPFRYEILRHPDLELADFFQARKNLDRGVFRSWDDYYNEATKILGRAFYWSIQRRGAILVVMASIYYDLILEERLRPGSPRRIKGLLSDLLPSLDRLARAEFWLPQKPAIEFLKGEIGLLLFPTTVTRGTSRDAGWSAQMPVGPITYRDAKLRAREELLYLFEKSIRDLRTASTDEQYKNIFNHVFTKSMSNDSMRKESIRGLEIGLESFLDAISEMNFEQRATLDAYYKEAAKILKPENGLRSISPKGITLFVLSSIYRLIEECRGRAMSRRDRLPAMLLELSLLLRTLADSPQWDSEGGAIEFLIKEIADLRKG